MIKQIRVDPSCQAIRWVSYLDLLGFTEIIRMKGWIYVFSHYAQALEHFIQDLDFDLRIEKTWFSDTFLLYSPDNTDSSFTAIESITRWFVNSLIFDGIPVRGAMACGDFYADKENSMFFGQALVEAYNYGENQDWIGFVLSPSAVNRMSEIGLPPHERLNYAYWQIPYKNTDNTLPESLPAYIIGGATEINNRNPYLDKLVEMKSRLKNVRFRRKYENTINFIEANKRTVVKR